MTTTDTTTQPIVDVPHVPPPVSDARLARLAEIADALHAAKLGGSWGWFGDVTCAGGGAYLATVGGGRRYLTGTMTKHEHWRVNDDRDDSWRVPSSCEGGDGCPLPTADDAKPGRAYRVDKPVPAFAVVGDKGWTVLRPGHEIPVFEVCRDATSEDDPRVYRTEVRGFRSPVAEWLAEADATTVRSLIDEVNAARDAARPEPLDRAALEALTEPTIVWATITWRGLVREQDVTWRGLVRVDEGEACRADGGQVGDWTWHPLTRLSDVYPAGSDPKPAGGAA